MSNDSLSSCTNSPQSLWQIQINGFCTILRKEFTRLFRIWTQTMLPTIVTSILYFLIFGSILGRQIDLEHSYSFIDFITPGLVMMAVLNNAYSNTSSVVFGLKFSSAIEEEMVSPMWPSIILWGHVLGGVVRGLLVGFLVLLCSLFFTHITIQAPLLLFATALCTSILFALAGFFNALFAKKFDDIALIPNFVLTPLSYLGGVFYSLHQLSPTWQAIAQVNPILYIINTTRYATIGMADLNPYGTFALVIPLIIVMHGICIYMIKDGGRLRL